MRTYTRICIAAAILAILAACGEEGAPGAETPDSEGPTVEIVSPADGEAVDGSFEIAVETDVDLGEPGTGLHHVHIFFDGDEAEYEMAFADRHQVEGLSPGEHTVEVVVANADHSLTEARQAITVEIGEEAAATPTTEPGGDVSSTTTTALGYDY